MHHPSSSSSSSLIEMQRDPYSYDEPASKMELFCFKRPKNDVFMNYSFKDIGKQFISHLKGALDRRGFTISDHSMLPAGQDTRLQVLKAIEDSEIYVVVFSTSYASFERSLDELVHIMDCLGRFHQRKILPVFYKFDPSDVRSQQGSFKEAFQAHKADEDIDFETVKKWKQTLKDVGQLSCVTFQNGDEEKFVWEIVEQVEKMQSPQELHVADHPVVIGSRAEELISTLRLDRDDVLVVAVFGISGIGKTTIVKATYNEIAPKFSVSCFLEDIDRCYSGRGDWKRRLQKDLISQINKDGNVKLHCDGVEKIKKLLRSRKTLLVLDDVDHFKRLEGLGINTSWFYKGSRIIVTTRDVDSLGGLPHTSYHTRLLNERESRKLFIRLMFAIDEPIHAKFVEEVVACAGGLPLVLKVWSRHFTQYKEHLPAALKTLKQIPHADVQKQLQMSYDSLSPEAKNLFLDIACFFNGVEKHLVIKVLNDDNFGIDYEIEKLAHKFLVENKGYGITVPHAIKEMGQEVVRQENPEEPGQRTRLMSQKDVVRVFRENSGTDSVRSIRLEERATVQLEAFKKMNNLRFIKLTSPNLQWSCCSNDDMSYSFKHLRYLEWSEFPCKSLDNIDMGNVVVIKLEDSKLEKLWEGANKSLKKLKILVVRKSRSLKKTGNFIGLENLEELDLCSCYNLKELDNSIGCLTKLVKLNLNFCERLKSLPWKMIGKLTSLENLDLSGCKRLKRLPWVMIRNLTCLKKLKLVDCERLKSLPWEMISKLTSLQSLNLTRCANILEISSENPNSLCQLHQLTKINFSDSTKLKSIPDLPPNIIYLDADRCINLVNLPSNISELKNLEELKLNDCFKLGSEGFTQVTRLRNLKRLQMGNCNVSQVSIGIGNLVSLEHLKLSGNPFSSLPETFSNLSKLKELLINDCSELQLLPPLPWQLEKIEATKCGSLDVMPFDSMQNAYIFCSKGFKQSQRIMSTQEVVIGLAGEELPEWCNYQNHSGNVLSFVAHIQFDQSKICGLVLCATRGHKDNHFGQHFYPTIYIYNKTKGTSHQLCDVRYVSGSMLVMFYPLNGAALVVEAGDTIELQFSDRSVKSCGLRLVYDDDVVDSGLVFKDEADTLVSSYASYFNRNLVSSYASYFNRSLVLICLVLISVYKLFL